MKKFIKICGLIFSLITTASASADLGFIKAVYIDGTGWVSGGDSSANTSAKLIETPIDKGVWTQFIPNSGKPIYNTAILGFAPISGNAIDTNKMKSWLAWPNNDNVTIGGTMETNLRKFIANGDGNQVLLSFGGGSNAGSWDSGHNPTDPKEFAKSIVDYIATTCDSNKQNCLFSGIDLDIETIFPFGGTDPNTSMTNLVIFLKAVKDEAIMQGLANFKISIAPQPYHNPSNNSNEFVLPGNPQVYFDKNSLSYIDYIFVQDYNLVWGDATSNPYSLLCASGQMANMYSNITLIDGITPASKIVLGKPAISATPCYDTPSEFTNDVTSAKLVGLSGIFIWNMSFDANNTSTFMAEVAKFN